MCNRVPEQMTDNRDLVQALAELQAVLGSTTTVHFYPALLLGLAGVVALLVTLRDIYVHERLLEDPQCGVLPIPPRGKAAANMLFAALVVASAASWYVLARGPVQA